MKLAAISPARIDDEVAHWHQHPVGRRAAAPGRWRVRCCSKPDWLFLDEATAAIDEAGEANLYKAICELLPNATIVSIGHRSTLVNFHDRRVHLVKDETGLHVAADAPLMPLAKG